MASDRFRKPSYRRSVSVIDATVAASAATKIQCIFRGQFVRCTGAFLARLFLKWVCTVQAIHRSRKLRLVYRLLILECIVPIQRIIRGYLTRREMKRIRKERLTAYRAQVFELWRRSCTSLAYRVKFWMFINRYRFLHLSLHEDELIKLWEMLGLKPLDYSTFRSYDNEVYSSCFAQMESRFGCKPKAVFHRFLIVQRKLDSVKTDPNKLEIHPVFPTEFALLKSASVNLTRKTQALKQAREKLSIEKEEIYKTLKTCKRTNPEVWERLYSSLKIPEAALQKKRKVVKMLWEHPAYAKTSLQVYFMMESYMNGDTISNRVGTSGRPSSGVTEEYTDKMIQAREAKLVLQADMINESDNCINRGTFGSISIRSAPISRQATILTAALKGLSWSEQRTILIQSFLFSGSKEKGFLISKAATLRQVNRRKRIRNRNRVQSSKCIAMPSSIDPPSLPSNNGTYRYTTPQEQRSASLISSRHQRYPSGRSSSS